MEKKVVSALYAFEYERAAPIEVREAGYEIVATVTIHDISYANPGFGRVSAYLVEPKRGDQLQRSSFFTGDRVIVQRFSRKPSHTPTLVWNRCSLTNRG